MKKCFILFCISHLFITKLFCRMIFWLNFFKTLQFAQGFSLNSLPSWTESFFSKGRQNSLWLFLLFNFDFLFINFPLINLYIFYIVTATYLISLTLFSHPPHVLNNFHSSKLKVSWFDYITETLSFQTPNGVAPTTVKVKLSLSLKI